MARTSIYESTSGGNLSDSLIDSSPLVFYRVGAQRASMVEPGQSCLSAAEKDQRYYDMRIERDSDAPVLDTATVLRDLRDDVARLVTSHAQVLERLSHANAQEPLPRPATVATSASFQTPNAGRGRSSLASLDSPGRAVPAVTVEDFGKPGLSDSVGVGRPVDSHAVHTPIPNFGHGFTEPQVPGILSPSEADTFSEFQLISRPRQRPRVPKPVLTAGSNSSNGQSNHFFLKI